MNCPKCGSETINKYCEKCGNSIREIYLKLSDDAQGNRDYNTAIMYLDDLTEILETQEEKEEIKRIRDGIEFIKINEETSGEKAVNPKNISWLRNLRISSKVRKLISILLFTVIAATAVYFGNEFYKKRDVMSNEIIDGRRVKTAIVLNLDYELNQKWDIADKVYYNRVFETLRKHKNIRVNLAITGRTIQAMNIYSPETMSYIKAGIRDGQFEMLGTTFSDAVIYSLSENSAKMQIEKDRNLKKEFFGNYPKGFWNSGNVWKDNLPELINGYSYTFISDELTAKASSLDTNFVRTTNGRKIAVITLDSRLNALFNKFIKANKAGSQESENEIYKYMRSLYKKDKSGKYVAAIGADLFNLEFDEMSKKEVVKSRLEKIERVLSVIESKPWIDSITTSSIALQEQAIENIESIPEGIYPDYNEKKFGYKSWIEYNNSSKEMVEYRKIEQEYEKVIIDNLESENKAVKNSAKYAREAFLHKSGKIGNYNKEEMTQNGEGSLLEVIKEVISNIKIYREAVYSKDINGDGKEEIVAIKNYNFYVFSSEKGGKLIYWIDMKTGKILTGGEVAGVNVVAETYVEAVTFEEKLKDKRYYRNCGVLNEILENSGITEKIYNTKMEFESPDSSTLIFKYGEFVKKIVMTNEGLNVSYTLPETAGEILVYNEIQPDYVGVINSSVKLKVEFDKGRAMVLNRMSKTGVEIKFPVESRVYSASSFAGEIIFIKTGLKTFNIELAKK